MGPASPGEDYYRAFVYEMGQAPMELHGAVILALVALQASKPWGELGPDVRALFDRAAARFLDSE